jgi:hypothetical protein
MNSTRDRSTRAWRPFGTIAANRSVRCGTFIHAVPHREIHPVVLLHLELCIEGREDLRGIADVGGQGALTEDVEHADRMHRRSGAVTGDVDHVYSKVIGVDVAVAEGIATEER